ncbi:uncharacterized protein [Drosophila virilis]|uniref:Uncharacterized protein n=1 Tax=Drosophila virilis TaxID=7244 RepID=B4MG22_DROVI|nr:uncharacterized protein LOC6636568 [Drosophila virilis]EDW58283.1 uncharacterized protein Dvir_GJ15460 [Drosophila virilis]
MARKSCCLLLLFSCLFVMAAAQYYTQYNPYNTPSPTFSSLNGYYYSTTSPYYYPTASTYLNDVRIRIWPYVIGQYLYPTYYNNNYYNPYASLSTPNWQSYYSSVYQNNWGKK